MPFDEIMNKNINSENELKSLKDVLHRLKAEGKILIALLYGSYAKGNQHKRSDIDLALYLKAEDEKDEMEIIDRILMSVDREVSILRLDDEDESPFVIQESLKGIQLIDSDAETLYVLRHRILHECEDIKFRRNILDKTINDIILCIVDIAEECLKKHGRGIPDTYKDTILSCHEFAGDIVLKVAPLVKHRNETIHQYLKINWQNIITVKNRISDIREFVEKTKRLLIKNE